MNRKQKIIVSITGIFIVLLALVGLTYAYFLTRITGNENDKSISVTTANLELVYGDGNGSLDAYGTITPGTKIKFLNTKGTETTSDDEVVDKKTFTVTNNGNGTVDSYAVILEDLIISYASAVKIGETTYPEGTATYLEHPSDMKLKVTCTSTKSGKTCDGMDGTFPTTNDILFTNSIDVGETHEYTLTMEYIESGQNQSADMNKSLTAKVNIIDTKDTVDIAGTVTNYGIGDYVEVHSTPRKATIDKHGNYKVVGLEPDLHEVKVVSDVVTAIEKIKIEKGKTASIGTTTVGEETVKLATITDESRTITLDINANTNSGTLGNEIKEYNPFDEGTLAYNIYKNAKDNKNGTELRSKPLNPVASGSSEYWTGEYNRGTTTGDFCAGYYSWCIGDTAEEAESVLSGGTCKTPNSYEETVEKFVYDQCDAKSYYIFDYNSNTKTTSYGELVKKQEKTLSLAQTNSGISYYYRGNVEDNYVNFAGMCWKIVRINDDESIKLILEDQNAECDDTTQNDKNNDGKVNTGAWNIPTNYGGTTKVGNFGHTNNKINYLNGTTDAESSMATAFKSFQNNNLKNNLSSLKAGGWCLDSKVYSIENNNYATAKLLTENEKNEYYSQEFYNKGTIAVYETFLRLNYNKTPNLDCNGTNLLDWNDDETKPTPMYVGTITADEMVYSGGMVISEPPSREYEKTYMMSDLNQKFWTLSPSGINNTYSGDSIFMSQFEHGVALEFVSGDHVAQNHAFRPAINLKKGIRISTDSGDGTQNNPYIVN